ncbi:MAG: hypothetical protein ACE37F_23315 [Nannocystaceae bacterium]|nr:hypothetical protein [bacterium]
MKPTLSLICLSFIACTSLACDVKQDLGETASSSGGAESGNTSGAETGALDTGPSEATGEPTTGPGTGSDTTTGSESGVLDTGPWWGSSSGTTGEELGACDASAPMVRWDSASLSPGDALGFGSTFVGVGSCTTLVEPIAKPENPLPVTIALSCTLSGARDGVDFVDEAIDIELDFLIDGEDPELALLPSLEETVRARFFVGSPGFEQGSDRFVVLEQPLLMGVGDAPVLYATRGIGLQPVAELVEPWHDGDWYDGPAIEAVDATCSTGEAPECGFDVALRTTWGGRPLDLHGGQAGSTELVLDIPSYDVYVDTAWEAPNSFECGEDFPGSDYAFVGFAM